MRWSRRLAVVACAASAAACSLIVDTTGLSGGADDASSNGDGSANDALAEAADGSGLPDAGTDATVDGDADAAPLDYPTTVLADGPISYFRLKDTTGTIAHDETGANDGSFKGTYQLGMAGPRAGSGSVRFTDGHVVADGVAKEPVGTYATYTLEAFISSEVPAGASQFIWAFALTGGGGGGPALWVDDTTRALKLTDHGATYSSMLAFTTTDWHHVAVTYASGTASVYVDGALDGTVAVSTPAPDRGTFVIACNTSAGDGGIAFGGEFTGRISEVAVYAKALSAAKIAAHYAAR